MFTGLIETSGRILNMERQGPGLRITIQAADMVDEFSLGESVAIDGACLTVVRFGGDHFAVEASAETLNCTTLGDRAVGDLLHLERAMVLGGRLGGHLVSGHIDATGTVRFKQPQGEALLMAFDVPDSVRRYLVPKGSIAVDGISLTVNGVDETGFDVVLIPHTQSIVRLHEKPVGARVNLESDLIGKYVERLLSFRGESANSSVDLDLLTKSGFTS